MQKSYFPSRDLIDLQVRHSNRLDKEAVVSAGLLKFWRGAVKRAKVADPEEGTGDLFSGRHVNIRATVTGPALPLGGRMLPAHAPVLPERGVGLGVHNPGVPHFASNTGTGNVSQRGRGDLHNGTPVSRREEKALELAMFEMKVKAQEERALKRAGKPGGRDAHKSALRMRRAYNLALSEFKSGGIMGRLHAFENGAARSGSGKAKSEAMKSEGAAPRARI